MTELKRQLDCSQKKTANSGGFVCRHDQWHAHHFSGVKGCSDVTSPSCCGTN